MTEIIPAIIADDFQTVSERLTLVEGLVNWVHLDATDGLFAPYLGWPLDFAQDRQTPDDLRNLNGKTKIEAHLMIEQPEEFLTDWLDVADRIIVHYEATEKLEHILDQLAHLPVKVGVALLLSTSLDVLDRYIDKIDLVQLMSIAEIGKQGYPFEERIFERIKTLRAKYPDVTIAVDGGVNLQNAPQLIAAGANNLVVGSAIWQAKNPTKTIQEFQKLCR